MTFRVLSPADDEIAEATTWYSQDQQSPQSAERFLEEVETAYKAIRRDPNRYPKRSHGFREWPLRKYPFRVLYTIEPDEIIVSSVKHNDRDSGYLERLKYGT